MSVKARVAVLLVCGSACDSGDGADARSFGLQRARCDQLVTCATAVRPNQLAEINGTYGPESGCWVDEAAADGCGQACWDDTVALLERNFDAPACVPVDLPHVAVPEGRYEVLEYAWGDSCFSADRAYFEFGATRLTHLGVGEFEIASAVWGVHCEATAWNEARCEADQALVDRLQALQAPASRIEVLSDLSGLVLRIAGDSVLYECPYEWSLHLAPEPG
jgi:hypothetical protein